MGSLLRGIRLRNCLWLLFGGGFLAFGLYNVHALSGVTEGGLLGLSLSYIPLRRILYSLITVLLSGRLVGIVERFPIKKKRAP